ncbi:RNA-dependent RNA polymerase [Erysiphe necator associated ambiguivirus 3]|nr:RNA-dependent RNA polymerase [Erysiphe necator associated ambiguivirus 3]
MVKDEVVCDHKEKRRMRLAVNTGAPATWVPGVHSNCNHNEIAALKLRSLAPCPTPGQFRLGDRFLLEFKKLRNLMHGYAGDRWSNLQTALSYEGSLRRRYLEAERSLRVDGPVTGGDAYLRAFLKAEKFGIDKVAKPRMIFPRSPRYNLCLGSWLKPLEHWLWGYLTAKRLFGGSSCRVVAKGLSPRQRANLIVRKFQSFKDCVVFEVDGKAFEAHVSREQLVQEHSIYLAAHHGAKELRGLLRHQLSLSGVTQGGVKFSRLGGRASGDFNTGMGNTLIMLCAVVSALRGRVRFDTLVDGDNALVFLERGDSSEVINKFASWVFDESGHEMTLERPVSCIEEVRFGRSAPIFLGHGLGYTMVREISAVLSGAFASHKWLKEPKFALRWCNGVARCELSLSVGLPVLQAFSLGVLKNTPSRKKVPVEALRDYFVVGGWLAGEEHSRPPTRECRVSFERAFGLSPEEQVRWEGALGRCRVDCDFDLQPTPDPRLLWAAVPGLVEPRMDERIWW